MDVSVVIPARNEIYLQRTIDEIFKAAKAETEVIAVIDGYEPEPAIEERKNLRLVVNKQAIGQRPAINQAARVAQGKYLLKTDAHSMLDEGFDVKLMENCEYDWTVLPRMYNLDVMSWEPKLAKKTDYMWFRSPYAKDQPFRVQYWDGPIAREFPNEYKEYKKYARVQGPIADVMTGQGACFFMHLQRFWELGGMDEAHGQWGQMGIEVALKAWLSGGRHVVNKNTWFAHYFRGGGGPGFPWPASGKQQELARVYSKDFWTAGNWDKQVRPLQWLVKKFWPLPTWHNPAEIKEYNTCRGSVVVV